MKIDKGALDHIRKTVIEADENGGLTDDVLHDAIVYAIHNTYDGTDVKHLQTASELESFRLTCGVRSDWRKPEEQEITATVIGHNLNTSSTHVDDVYDHDESWKSFTVVFHEEATNENNIVTGPGKPLAYANLAQVLAWACQTGATQLDDEE